MDADLFLSPASTNNNPPGPVKKKWSTASAMESLEEVMETADHYAKSDELLPPALPRPHEDKRGRRKSWHPSIAKFEKKRRKSATATGAGSPPGDDIKYHRQKRPSWWTIFVPDNFHPKVSK